ncbi:hypothetical protein [Methylophaga frappieri]|nr:hypothetical protein [Methylophaga frappieri]
MAPPIDSIQGLQALQAISRIRDPSRESVGIAQWGNGKTTVFAADC